jgi:hypothetical protein
MKYADQKTRDEWQFLRSFRHLCADFPSGEIRKHEGPYFLIAVNATITIGIEIARVYKGYGQISEQSIEATKEAITTAARQYAETGLKCPPVHVSLFFTLSRPLKREARQQISHRVAKAVHENMPPEGQLVELRYRRGGVQPIEVDQILINRYLPRATHEWIWPEYASIQREAIAIFQHRIDNKSKKHEAYLRNCTECWLLIVAHSFKSSSNIHPDDPSLSHIYTSTYSRTYFLDFGFPSLCRLETHPWGARS